MRYLFTMILVGVAITGFTQTKSEKRGLSYGHHSTADLQALAPGLSWYYNWYHQPEPSVINTYDDYNFDYVPMAWNGAFDKQAMHDFLSTHPNVKYILGWNEPNFIDQANMTPSQAAAMWPDIEELADEFGLEIVGPAVNYCGNCVSENGTTYTDPIKYLDDFFTACDGCRVDHIAIHCYMANVSALQWYVGLFKKYEKPIWLTEFAAWEGDVTLEQQKSFMVGAVDYLENDPDVFRYAWFTGRHTGAPYIGVLNGSGVLTDLGKIYVNMPTHDPDAFTLLPAKIEAENYNRMDGILLELTQDVSGIANVGYIDAADWMEYNVDVPADGTYYITARIASNRDGSIQITSDGTTLTSLPFTNTGGYQIWKTFKISVALEAGQQTLRFKANTNGFNLNWIEFKDESVMANEEDLAEEIVLYPNPTNGTVSIASAHRWEEITIVNALGVPLQKGAFVSSLDMQRYATGTYIIKLKDHHGKTAFKRVVKQ